MRGLRTTLGAALCALCLPAPGAIAAPAGDPAAFDGQGMWIYVLAESNGGDVESIAREATARGVTTIFMKAGDGTRAWPQFSRGFVDALHAHGLRVCAYSRIFARRPAAGARVSARAVLGTGADCFVIDAEAEYEGRYRQARAYVRELRRRIGPDYPVGLTSFPYVDLHPRLPYSEFLGPGGAQFNLPQVYWRAIGDPVGRALARTYAWNGVYGRPIRPIGQLWMDPPAAQVGRFRELVAAYGSPGLSWWSWQSAGPRALRGLARPLPLPLRSGAPALAAPARAAPRRERRRRALGPALAAGTGDGPVRAGHGAGGAAAAGGRRAAADGRARRGDVGRADGPKGPLTLTGTAGARDAVIARRAAAALASIAE